MTMHKLFKGADVKALATEVAAFYNRQGRMGNHVSNAKILTYENGEVGVSVVVTGDRVDDGRQIDDIEERKSFIILKTDGTDLSELDTWMEEHKDDDISRLFVEAVGNETLYFYAATKARQTYLSDFDEEEDEEADDWIAAGTPTAAPDTSVAPATPTQTTSELDAFN